MVYHLWVVILSLQPFTIISAHIPCDKSCYWLHEYSPSSCVEHELANLVCGFEVWLHEGCASLQSGRKCPFFFFTCFLLFLCKIFWKLQVFIEWIHDFSWKFAVMNKSQTFSYFNGSCNKTGSSQIFEVDPFVNWV